MTLSNGQALVGAHIPKLVPLRETAKLPLNASTVLATEFVAEDWPLVLQR